MTDGPVMLGFIHGGWVRAEFLNSVLSAASGPNASKAIGGVISSTAGPLIALARNNLVQQFLASNMEWLCMIDTDIVFAPDAIDRLFAEVDGSPYPVISALYYVFDDKGKKSAAVYSTTRDDGVLDFKTVDVENYLDKVARVEAVGAGFLLAHRRVFEKIQKLDGGDPSWFREVVIDGRDFGEDMAFCVRAISAGIEIYVHTGVRVGHIKSAMLGEVT